MPVTGPIPLPKDFDDAFNQGLLTSQSIFDSLVRNRMTRAQAQAQEAKNPFVGKQAEADLINQQNINKMYIPNVQSEINERQAITRLKNQLYNNPGLAGSGVEHELASYIIMHPKEAKLIHEAYGTQQADQQQQMQEQQRKNLLQRAQEGLQARSASMTPINNNQPNPFTQNAPSMTMMQPETQTPQNQQTQQEQQQPSQPQQVEFNPVEMFKRNILADIAEKESKAEYYKTGLGGGRGGVKAQNRKQTLLDIEQLNPDFNEDETFEAYGKLLGGKTTLDSGKPININDAVKQDVINVQGTGATTGMKNQLIQYDLLVNGLDSLDIDAIKSFAGPKGIPKLIVAQGKMALNPDDPTIDPVARRYLATMNDVLINMDKMRKAFGTSVVPDYVYKTIGTLTNPNASIWQDPKQVEMSYNKVLKEMKKDKTTLEEKIRHGVLSSNTSNQESAPVIQWVRKDGKLVRAD